MNLDNLLNTWNSFWEQSEAHTEDSLEALDEFAYELEVALNNYESDLQQALNTMRL